MKLNTDKCRPLSNNQELNTLKIGDLHTDNSLREKLLGVNFDCKLKFKSITGVKCTHCVKKVQIQSHFWSVFSCFWTDCGPDIAPYLHTFHAATRKTCTIHGNNQKSYSYECIF